MFQLTAIMLFGVRKHAPTESGPPEVLTCLDESCAAVQAPKPTSETVGLRTRSLEQHDYEKRIAPMAEYSKYQRNIIKNYYDNQEGISLQRLSELVTELYLAEGKARARQWKNIVSALEKLKVPASRIEHLQKQDNPALLAKLVEELMAKQK